MVDDLLSTYEVCERAELTFRQLDYWARAGVVTPALPAETSGTPRGWTDEQATAIAVGARARAAGLPLAEVAEIIDVVLHGGTLGDVVRWPLTMQVVVEIDVSDLRTVVARAVA